MKTISYKKLREKIGWSDQPWIQDLLESFIQDVLDGAAPGLTLADLIEHNTKAKSQLAPPPKPTKPLQPKPIRVTANYIDATPSWEGLVRTLVSILQDPARTSIWPEIINHFQDMGRVADAYVRILEEQRSSGS